MTVCIQVCIFHIPLWVCLKFKLHFEQIKEKMNLNAKVHVPRKKWKVCKSWLSFALEARFFSCTALTIWHFVLHVIIQVGRGKSLDKITTSNLPERNACNFDNKLLPKRVKTHRNNETAHLLWAKRKNWKETNKTKEAKK